MHHRWAVFVVLCCGFVPSILPAGEFNEVLKIGDTAPAWNNLPGTDGQKHGLAEFKEKPVVVVAFTCLSCPTARDYEDRLNSLAKKHSGPDGKVGVVAICVNRVAEDRLEKLTENATKKSLAFPYLYDDSQKIARDYGALFTPEYFVLNAERKIVYMGAFDNATDAQKVTVKHVELAVEAALSGKLPDVKETIGRGCRIRYARDRSTE